MAEFPDPLKQQIILSAMITAGPGADDGQVTAEVSKAIRLLTDGSPALAAFERAEQRAGQTVDVKRFTGELLYVDTETTSNRPIAFLRTQPSEHHPDGVEVCRLDRLDSQEGESARALARQLVSLIGHKVLVTIAVEKASGKNVRILRGVEDRGAGGQDIAGIDISTGWQLINWQESDRVKLASKLKKLGERVQAAAVPA